MPKKSPPFIDKHGEVRSLRAADKVKMTPLKHQFPDLAEFSLRRKRGRPKSLSPKKLQTFKLSAEIVDAIRDSGAGYNVRVEKVLREALLDGRI